MPRSIPSSPKAPHLLFILAILITLLSPFVHAQKFRPAPANSPCGTFVEGQGLYVVGGDVNVSHPTPQAFMLDLSVSWDTSNPVFKKLPDHPIRGIGSSSCTMTPKGEILTTGSTSTISFLYNVKSNAKTWTNISTSVAGVALATDPESGLTYVLAKDKITEVNLKTKEFKEFQLPASGRNPTDVPRVAWSSPMRSLLVDFMNDNLIQVFTPSKANDSSHGWKELSSAGEPIDMVDCFMPAYNGSKMVASSGIEPIVYILDVATLTWTSSPPTRDRTNSHACGISGDQVIFWGGSDVYGQDSNNTYIYNMKTEKWTSRYISPKDTPSTTGLQTPTQHSEPVDASQGLSKNVVNVAIAAGVIVAIALVAASVYIGYRTRPNPDTESTGTSGSVPDLSSASGKGSLEESHRFRGQDYPTPAPIGGVTVQTARLQQGSTGARDTQEHPHAIVKGSIAGYSS